MGYSGRFMPFVPITKVLGAALAAIFGKRYEHGSIVLSHGKHEVEIETKDVPDRVWISFERSGEVPVCHGDVDKIGVHAHDDGFLIYADIHSTSCNLRWFTSVNERRFPQT